ncbi:MAG: cytochrome b/b6 domain-containing protein [Acidimicrobiales bacterium]
MSLRINQDGVAQEATRGQDHWLDRFDLVERAVHWTTALLMLELLATGAILYIPSLSIAVGHRAVVASIHVFGGIALLVPVAIGVAGPWRGRLLRDLRRLDSWSAADWEWFRRPRRRLGLARGKFNGGQKAEAAFVAGGMIVMLASGTIMRFAPASLIDWQQGATLVHDCGFVAIGIGLAVHIYYGLTRPEQLRSMLTGRIPRSWAAKNAPAWDEEAESGQP